MSMRADVVNNTLTGLPVADPWTSSNSMLQFDAATRAATAAKFAPRAVDGNTEKSRARCLPRQLSIY
jgi:hypothetical protein